MVRAGVSVMLGSRVEVLVPCWQTRVPGLVVHRAISPGTGRPGKLWAVTHAQSGRSVVLEKVKTRARALWIAGRLGELPLDWEDTPDGLANQVLALSAADRDQFHYLRESCA